MKKSIVIFLLFSAFGFAKSVGQDTVRVKLLGKNIVTVVDGHGNNTKVDVGNNVVHVNSSKDDTVKIRVGRSAVIIRSGRHNSNIRLNHLNDGEYELWTGKSPGFKGHWAGWEMGLNSFSNVDYKGFMPNFMDLNQNKSFETGINFLEYNIGLKSDKNNIGLVTGLGITYNDYRFSNAYTIVNNGGFVEPVALNEHNLSKSKLSATYLSIPLLLEFQSPEHGHNKPFYFSAGLIGGIKLGSHTKVKMDGDKSKSHGDFNINPFRIGATARMGYRGINVFGTTYFSPLFRNGRGPELFPFTIGIVLMNW